MPKLFVVSDIHGFYNKMIKALNEAGFDKNNLEHWLIVCGDCFDRGPEPAKVMRYLQSLPRKVLIKGNHEQLLVDLCERGFPYSYDRSNGTLGTAIMLDPTCIDTEEINYDVVLQRVRPFLDSMVNYFESKSYIFVHSWLPLINKDGLPAHYTRNRCFEFDPNWREAGQDAWNDAMWGNPFALAEQGLFPDKATIIFGHWHCSTGWAKDEGRSEFGDDAKFDPYYGKKYISIDACTAYSGKVNVVVLEDEFLDE